MPPKLCLNQRTQERCVLGGPGKRYQPHLEAARPASAWEFGCKPEAQGEEGDSRFWARLSHQLIKIGTARPQGALLLPHPHGWFMQSPDGSCRDREQSQRCALRSRGVELASAPCTHARPRLGSTSVPILGVLRTVSQPEAGSPPKTGNLGVSEGQ